MRNLIGKLAQKEQREEFLEWLKSPDDEDRQKSLVAAMAKAAKAEG